MTSAAHWQRFCARTSWLISPSRLAGYACLLLLTACDGSTHLSFLHPQGPVADAQRYHFFQALAVLAVFVALPIFVLLPWFAWRYRYGAKKSRYTPRWEFSRWLEIFSWAGPVVIVALLGFIVWRDAARLDPYRPLISSEPPLRVQAIGYDWKWLFIYPDQGIASIGTLAVPVGRPVLLQITSATVMQSLFVPALGSQMYAMGGMVTQLNLQADKAGRSLGENTMYSGDGFHQQHFAAVAMTTDDFGAWVGKVRAGGIPLDAQALKIVSQPSTRSKLVADLHAEKFLDGNIYFNGVSKTLFPAVVKATMGGMPMPSQHGLSATNLSAASNTSTRPQKP